tara:strand:+ start:126697 stop:127269 length:573 start_codon:yes stop_codon:yes gene_type:complete
MAYTGSMGALNKNPLFNIDKKAIKISPFWKFYLHELVIQLRKEMHAVFRKSVQVELINSQLISYNSADFELGEDFNQLIWCHEKNCPLYISIPNQSANKLVNLLLGNNAGEYIEKRFLTKLDTKCLQKFCENIIKQMNLVMESKQQDINFKIDKQFINQDFYGLILSFQVDYIPINIYIPEQLFKFNLVD